MSYLAKPFDIEITMELEYQFCIAKKEKNNVKTCRRGVHKAVIYDKCSIPFFKKKSFKVVCHKIYADP